jgi:dihydroxy-acid dehydratase
VLHTAPEAAVGGPLALVQNGDEVVLDVAARRLDLLVSQAELDVRKSRWTPPPPEYERGYYSLFRKHVMQADSGADFDFLVGKSGAKIPRDSH